MVASLLETIVFANLLCGSAQSSPVPRWIRVLVLHTLAPLVLLSSRHTDENDTVIQNPGAQGKVRLLCSQRDYRRIVLSFCSHISSSTELKVSSLASENGETQDQKEVVGEDAALQQLRILGRNLKAIRRQVEDHVSESQSSGEWAQVGFVIDRLLFGLYVLFISVSFITIIVMWVQSYKKA